MNQRAVLFVLLGLFVSCFVGTCAVGTLTAINGVASGVDFDAPPRLDPPPPPDDVPMSDPTSPGPAGDPLAALSPPDDAVPGEDAEPPAYAAPLLGIATYAVYYGTAPKTDGWDALQKALRGTQVKAYREEAPPEAVPPYVEFQSLAAREYGIPQGDALDSAVGLSAAQKTGLAKSRAVIVLVAATPPGTAPALEVMRAVAAFAQATGGVLWDDQTQQYFSVEGWRGQRVASWDRGVPQVSLNVTVFANGDGDTLQLETAGLQHFGLPELRLAAVPRELEDEGVALLQAVAQVLVEDKDPPGPGLYRVALGDLKHASERKRLEALAQRGAEKATDVLLTAAVGADDPMLAVGLPGAGAPQERLEAALTELFGTTVLPGRAR